MSEIREALVGDGSIKVTSDGKVFSKRRKNGYDKRVPEWHEICQEKKNGYVSVMVKNPDGKRSIKSLHRLIAEAFIPNPFPDHLTQVNHIDGDKRNNNVRNLEWTTPRDNVNEAVRIGLIKSKKHYCVYCGKEFKQVSRGSCPCQMLCNSCRKIYTDIYLLQADSERQNSAREIAHRAKFGNKDIERITGVSKAMASRWLRGERNLKLEYVEMVEAYAEREVTNDNNS